TAHGHGIDAFTKLHRPAVEARTDFTLARTARHGLADPMELRVRARAVVALAVVLAEQFPVRMHVVLDALAAHELADPEAREIRKVHEVRGERHGVVV